MFTILSSRHKFEKFFYTPRRVPRPAVGHSNVHRSIASSSLLRNDMCICVCVCVCKHILFLPVALYSPPWYYPNRVDIFWMLIKVDRESQPQYGETRRFNAICSYAISDLRNCKRIWKAKFSIVEKRHMFVGWQHEQSGVILRTVRFRCVGVWIWTGLSSIYTYIWLTVYTYIYIYKHTHTHIHTHCWDFRKIEPAPYLSERNCWVRR
jgi:hypothetical protein